MGVWVNAGRPRAALLLVALAASLFCAAGPALAQKRTTRASQSVHVAQPEQVINVQIAVNKSKVIEIPDGFKEASVGKADIADVVPMNNRQLYVLGRASGLTSVSLFSETNHLVAVVQVEVTPDVDAMSRALHSVMPDAAVRPRAVNGRVVLEGSVADGPDARRAVTIANEFAPNSVTNALSVGRNQQVMLEVRFVEVSRSADREIGIDWRVQGNRLNLGTGPFLGPNSAGGTAANSGVIVNFPSGNAPFGAAIARVLAGGVTADVLIRALEERGLARRLAEPNLVALSGETANFLAGGEFPFPVFQASTGGGTPQLGVEFKKYGVGLSFTPTVLSQGIINLKIEPEVSSIDPNSVVQIGSILIPSLIVRRANTTVELRDGQSFAIAGLLQTLDEKSQSQMPWLGQVPVIGALFRSAAFNRQETDLVIIITPHLVKPLTPTQAASTPLDNHAPGNDVDFFLNGQNELPRAQNVASTNISKVAQSSGIPSNKYGHIIEMRRGNDAAQAPQ